jgi:hypothetical protein
MELSNIATMALKVSQNQQVRSLLSRLLHKIYKRLSLKKVHCIIMEDDTRLKLSFDFNKNKYYLVDLEKVFKCLLSEQEKEQMKNIKLLSYEIFISKYSKQLKEILNILRYSHKDKELILLMSDVSLCHALHCHQFNTYLMNDNEFNLMISKVENQDIKEYLNNHREKHLKKNTQFYKTLEELKYMLFYEFS